MNRDPKVVWDDQNQNWVMVIFLDNDRYMFLYSDNLLHWEQGETIRDTGERRMPGSVQFTDRQRHDAEKMGALGLYG